MTTNSPFEFELRLNFPSEIDTSIEDAIFEAGCDDATLCSRGDAVWLTFTREAPTFKDAVLSAISDVHAAKINATVLSVEAEKSTNSSDLNELALINQMLELFRPATKMSNCNKGALSQSWLRYR